MADIEKINFILDSAKSYVDLMGTVLGEMPEQEGGTSGIINEKWLESSLGSADDLNLKKLAAAALIIAKEKGVISEEVVSTGITAANIAAEGISRVKTAYQVGIGQLDVYDAADQMIDMAAARLPAVADAAVEKGIDLALVAAMAYPQARPVVMLVKSVQPLVTKVSQVAVRVGIKKVATVAKKTVRKVGEAAKSFVKKIFSKK